MRVGDLVEYPPHSGAPPTWERGVGVVVGTGFSPARPGSRHSGNDVVYILSEHGTVLPGIPTWAGIKVIQ